MHTVKCKSKTERHLRESSLPLLLRQEGRKKYKPRATLLIHLFKTHSSYRDGTKQQQQRTWKILHLHGRSKSLRRKSLHLQRYQCMKHTSQSISHRSGKYSGCSSVAVKVHPSCTCCGPIPSSASCWHWCDGQGSDRQEGAGSEKGSSQKLPSAHLVTTQTPMHSKITSVKPEAKEKHSFDIYGFQTPFPGEYWYCLLPQCLLSCLHHAKCFHRHAVDFKNNQNKAQENHPQTTKTH